MRVFIGTVDIAGYQSSLAEGFAELGVDVVRVAYVRHPFGYVPPDRPGWMFRLIGYTAARRGAAATRGSASRHAWRVAQFPIRAILLAWVILRCDAVLLGYGSRVFSRFDLPLLRLCRKPVVCSFHGSDSRPPYIDGFLSRPDARANHVLRQTKRTIRRIRWHERFATAIVSHAPSSQLHRRPFVPSFVMGSPTRQIANEPVPRMGEPGPVRILHAPSNPDLKGTEVIRATIDRLVARGHKIDFIEIRGRPNSDVIAALWSSDLVVDQVYSDQPLASFAAEAASLGVPTVVSGYAADDPDAKLTPVPSLFVRPEQLEDAIVELLEHPEERVALGRRAYEFVTHEWHPREVAQRYLALLNGTASPEWLLDPRTITYPLGCGLHREAAAKVIRDLIAHYGIGALGVEDNPELEQRLIDIAVSTQKSAAVSASTAL